MESSYFLTHGGHIHMREPYFSGAKYSWFWLELKMSTFCGALCGGSQTPHHLDKSARNATF